MSTQRIVPTLHHLASSQSFRILFALEELAEAHGTQYKLQNYARSTQGPVPSMKGYFPLGKSPIVTVEEDGEASTTVCQLPQYPGVLTESRLILQFLSDIFGQGMWECQDPIDKAQDTFFQELSNNTLGLKNGFAIAFEVIPSQLPFGLRQLVGLMVRPVVNHFLKDLYDIFQVMEDALSQERPWFSGKRMGLADLNMTWGMDVASQRGYFSNNNYPKVAAWHQRICERPAYQRALEKGGTYDLVNFL